MTSEQLEFDRCHLWHPYGSVVTPTSVWPVVAASGSRFQLADGTALIDAVSSWWCMAHGHNHPHITAAIRAQSEQLCQVMFAGLTHAPAVKLARLLLRRAPTGLDKVFYVDSGSVSVECAAKLAVQYQTARGHSGRFRLAALRGGYHGDTTGAMALSDPDGMHTAYAPLLQQHFFAPRPPIAFDAAWDAAGFAGMAELLQQHHEEIAAVIVEPVFQGANAMYFYHPEYLRSLRQACDHYGILLIFDEIATGFGRIGRFFAAEYSGVSPDIMCVGKALTGGALPLAAVLVNGETAETVCAVPPGCFMHGPTFMANPLACAAGCASLQLFDSSDWQGAVQRIEVELRQGLEPLREISAVRAVRVLGAVGVVELSERPDPDEVRRICHASGVWLRPFGPYLYTMPPFITTSEEIAQICLTLRKIALRVG